MLEDCLVESRPSARKNPLTLALSVITHGSIIGALILIPLFQDQVLPLIPAIAPMRPPEVAVRAVELIPSRAPRAASSAAPPRISEALFIPPLIPNQIAIVVDEPISTGGFTPSLGTGGSPFGLSNIIGDGPYTPGAAPPPPPLKPVPPPAPPRAPDPPPTPAAPVPVGGLVQMSSLIYQVAPSYPSLARTARVQGVVQLEAVITREGLIDPGRLRVISGHPLLTQAAVDAVKQWRYRPTLLKGGPVEVITTITINFNFN